MSIWAMQLLPISVLINDCFCFVNCVMRRMGLNSKGQCQIEVASTNKRTAHHPHSVCVIKKQRTRKRDCIIMRVLDAIKLYWRKHMISHRHEHTWCLVVVKVCNNSRHNTRCWVWMNSKVKRVDMNSIFN